MRYGMRLSLSFENFRLSSSVKGNMEGLDFGNVSKCSNRMEVVEAVSHPFVDPDVENGEIYIGYGEEKYERTLFSARKRVESIRTETEFFDAIFQTCCFDENGAFSGDRMLDVLLLNYSEGDEMEVLNKLLRLSEKNNTSLLSEEAFKSAADNLKDSMEKLLKLRRHFKDDANEKGCNEVLTDLRRFSCSSMSSTQSEVPRRESITSISSLGILDPSNMSTISCESFEGLGGDTSHRDLVELVNEINELQFQNKKLNEENSRFRMQSLQTDDMYQQMIQENDDLKKRIASLQKSLDKSKELHISNKDLKLSLQVIEDTRINLQKKLDEMEKLNASLQENIQDLEEKLYSSNSEVETSKKRELELLLSVSQQKVLVQDLHKKNDELESRFKEQSLKYEDLGAALKDLTESNMSLRQDKHTLEEILARTEEGFASLLEGTRTYSNEQVSEIQESAGIGERIFSNDLVCSKKNAAFFKRNELFSSTPVRCQLYLHGVSLHTEMNSAMSSNENLPSPFCGKYIIPNIIEFSQSPLLHDSPPPKKMRSFMEIPENELPGLSILNGAQDSKCNILVTSNQSRGNFYYRDRKCKRRSNLSTFSPEFSEHHSASSVTCYSSHEGPTENIKSEIKEAENKLSNTVAELNKMESFLGTVLNYIKYECRFLEKKNIEVEHVVKVNKGREQTETKNYVNEDEVGIHLDPVMTTNLYDDVQMSSEDNHLVTDLSTSDVREQINMEIRALRTQIGRSNALLSYLQTKENLINYQQKSVHILRKQNLSLEEQNADSFDGQVPSLCYNNANRSSSSITSHKSTPLHKSCLAQSCPILPSEISAISRSTQTEPLKLMESICENQGRQKAEVLSSGDLSYQRHCDSFPISDSTNLKRFVQIAQHPEILPDHSPTRMKATQFNLNESPVSPHFPRHRSHSFLIAVKQGNPKLVDANFHEKQSGLDKVKSSLNSETDIETVSKISHPYFGSSSSVAKKCVSLDVTSSNRGLLSSSGGSRSTSLPLEHEHTPGNTFSKSYDAGDSNVKEITAKERIISSEEKVKEGKSFDKTGKNPQRSVRRGSGTGSPNSLLSIPRYPAFDLSEQEDVHGLINPLTDSKVIKDANPVSNETIANADACNDHEMQPKSPVLRLKDASQKKREASKSKTLMPDLMETSETESAKGSFEYETPEVILPSETSSSLDSAFPSLKDLVELGVSKDSPHPPETFSEQELQDKFATISLAFKTDKMTLSKRVELQKRQRDNAEKEVEREIKTLKNSLNILSLNCTSSDARDLISKVQNDIDSVQNATLRMSGRSEAYGALQQEERVCRAFEVLLLHVDILKRSLDREHRELEEARRILSGTKALAKEIGSAEVISDDSKKSLRTIGLAVGTLKSTVRRRASVSVLHPHTLPDGVKARSFSSSWTAGSGNFKDTKNRLISALCPFTSTGSIGLISSSSSSTYLSAPLSPSYSSVCSEIDRRCSLPVSPGRALIGHNASRITEIEKGSSFSSGIPEKETVEQNLKNTQQLYVVSDIEEQPEEEVVFEEETSLIDESFPKGGEDCTDNVVSNSCRLSDISENIEVNEALYNSETMKSELDISSEKADIKRKKSFVEKYSSPKLLEHWNKTSGLTLFRYSVSMLLLVMAVLCFLVIFLPCQAIPKESENFEDAMELILQTYFRPKYLDKPV